MAAGDNYGLLRFMGILVENLWRNPLEEFPQKFFEEYLNEALEKFLEESLDKYVIEYLTENQRIHGAILVIYLNQAF